jgi:peptidoglycan L-alanyl-D-glutamate endopeptidase CwlK
MPLFSERSLRNLNECDGRLRKVFKTIVKTFDCSVICGHRDLETQEQMFEEGKTQLHWPHSKHNSSPSMAVDVVPYPIGWGKSWEKDYERRMVYFAGFVLATSQSLDIPIVWGGDWDRDWELRDNKFNDYPHFEIEGM